MTTENTALQNYARGSGALFLLIIIIALLNTAGIDSRLIAAGDTTQTIQNLKTNEQLFRVGILAMALMYAGVVALSGTLYATLKKADEKLALIAMLFRGAEGILGAATALLGLLILATLKNEGLVGALLTLPTKAVTGYFLAAREESLNLVLLFAGFGGTIYSYLFLKARYVPILLAAWGILTYLSMGCLAMLGILWPDQPQTIKMVLFGAGALFEIIFGIWLLMKGVSEN